METTEQDDSDALLDGAVVLGLDPATLASLARKKSLRLMPLVRELRILTKERGVVRLGDVMNYAQAELVAESERQLATTGQIRVIILKARQIGMSTMVEAILFALSMLKRDFKSLIISHEKDSAEGLLVMTRRYWDTYIFKRHYVERYNGKAHLEWADWGSQIQVATAKNVEAGRSKTIHGLHASEVAFWDDPETLMTGLNNSIPTFGVTVIILESTANGIGNYFHQQWNEASKGESDFTPMFFPWYKHPEYRAAYMPPGQAERYPLTDLTDEERQLRRMGITDDRLIWRRWAIVNKCLNSVEKFHQEYPTTPHEAFVSTGLNVFPLPSLIQHYKGATGHRGELVEVNGKIKFHQTPNGSLTIFAYPSQDREWGVYLIGADPTHSIAGDYACAQVINRRTLEVVATLRKKIDPMNFGRELVKLGYYYNTALIAPEKTGPGYGTIGVINEAAYPNLFQMAKIDSTPGQPLSSTYGWATNRQTKQLAIGHLKAAILEPIINSNGSEYGLIIHDQQTIQEMRDYVTTDDGQGFKNGDGSLFDDGVMALAIAVAAHIIEPAPPVYSTPQPKLERSQVLGVGPIEETIMVERLPVPADGKPHATTYDPTVMPVDEQRPQSLIVADTAPWEEWDEYDEQ